MNIRKLWPLLPLALAVSFVVANGQGLGGGGAVQTQAARKPTRRPRRCAPWPALWRRATAAWRTWKNACTA